MEKRLEELEKEVLSLKDKLSSVARRQEEYVPLLVDIPKFLMLDINMAANKNKCAVEDYVTSCLFKYVMRE